MPKRAFQASSALGIALLSLLGLLMLRIPLTGRDPDGPPIGIVRVAPIFPDLNVDPFHRLMLLPHVGLARAGAIVRERRRGEGFCY